MFAKIISRGLSNYSRLQRMELLQGFLGLSGLSKDSILEVEW